MRRVSIHTLTSRFKFNSFPCVYHLVANRFAVYWVTEMKKMIVAPEGSEDLAEEAVIAHSQYQNSKRISIFLSMQDEIDMEEIIKDIFRQGEICFIPRYQFQSNHMDMDMRLASPEEISLLPQTSWNIHQPREGDVWEEALSTDFHSADRHHPSISY
ncbi:5-formyltetrahydrofolate cyclo-ligase-like isoform X2 [Peromyscus maniculatus bairdii]|uniref:5-formyltetrahydrofolate cyclo-ligase-like isoform X2 n=1 Tax=Peromyscus maniculatus bairdii TaxID=230844 RepID=UPI003FD5E802